MQRQEPFSRELITGRKLVQGTFLRRAPWHEKLTFPDRGHFCPSQLLPIRRSRNMADPHYGIVISTASFPLDLPVLQSSAPSHHRSKPWPFYVLDSKKVTSPPKREFSLIASSPPIRSRALIAESVASIT